MAGSDEISIRVSDTLVSALQPQIDELRERIEALEGVRPAKVRPEVPIPLSFLPPPRTNEAGQAYISAVRCTHCAEWFDPTEPRALPVHFTLPEPSGEMGTFVGRAD